MPALENADDQVERTTSPLVHIIRHGQALHNIDRGYPHRDPPLTDAGHQATKHIEISAVPDLIIISPMTRTIQTAINAFPSIGRAQNAIEVKVWPDLRETHDAICNKGISRADISARFPFLDFSECPEQWDYPRHTIEAATIRAEKVRARLKALSKVYSNVVLITHRGFIAFLVKGDRYDVCETRSYRFGADEEIEAESLRFGVNIDTETRQDFGPTVLVPHRHQGSSTA
jgi:broad specificity phosphatase PhoE